MTNKQLMEKRKEAIMYKIMKQILKREPTEEDRKDFDTETIHGNEYVLHRRIHIGKITPLYRTKPSGYEFMPSDTVKNKPESTY